uniref:Uncharacterized protein n=1 Tax=Parascaris univalens TaxID=6257 RepID=A0A915ALW9_PARUN
APFETMSKHLFDRYSGKPTSNNDVSQIGSQRCVQRGISSKVGAFLEEYFQRCHAIAGTLYRKVMRNGVRYSLRSNSQFSESREPRRLTAVNTINFMNRDIMYVLDVVRRCFNRKRNMIVAVDGRHLMQLLMKPITSFDFPT